MISIKPFIEKISHPGLIDYLEWFEENIEYYFSNYYHGDFTRWQLTYNTLHAIKAVDGNIQIDLTGPTVKIGKGKDLSPQQKKTFRKLLKEFMPWRKGPYEIFGIKIDTEWRSDWKWDRIKNHIHDLADRFVLDIGCGNGYHCWRTLGAGAKAVMGVDPMLHYVMQFNVFKSYARRDDIIILPQKIEDLPDAMSAFDTVFSMGVLYHRRSPLDHLFELKNYCRPGGEVVLETLVIDGSKGESLVPDNRYAKMRNVWFIPSLSTLEGWLERCGYKNIHLADVQKTSIAEQRVTEWMQYESLQQFLDPENPDKTIEGYPAPQRAVFICDTPA